MQISKDDFYSIGQKIHIPLDRLQTFWEGLENRSGASSEASSFAKYLYYLGGVIIIVAMTWLTSVSWEVFGGAGLFLIAFVYILIFTLLGNRLSKQKGMRIPAGLLFTCAVAMVPLAIFGLELHFGILSTQDNTSHYNQFYSLIDAKWIVMELATILAGAFALYYYPFPFITAPICAAVWFLSMDIANLFHGGKEISWNERAWISVFFGIALIAIGFIIDKRKNEDFGFWSYFFGTVSFWGGLNALVWSNGEGALVIYLFINLLMMLFAVVLRRKVLMVFGAFGLFAYLSHLAYDLFKDSIMLPFALTGIGLLIIYLGILYQRNQKNIEDRLEEIFPIFKR